MYMKICRCINTTVLLHMTSKTNIHTQYEFHPNFVPLGNISHSLQVEVIHV